MIDFRTHWIPFGLPDSVFCQAVNVRYLVDTLGADHVAFGTGFPLPVHADPAGAFVAGLDGAEAGWVRDGTASVLLGLH